MDKTPQFRSEMRKSWDLVDDKFDGVAILGKKASEILLRHAARASHHEFPYSMTILAQLVGCTNGAATEVFPGVLSPLVLTMFNNNQPQTTHIINQQDSHKKQHTTNTNSNTNNKQHTTEVIHLPKFI